MLYRSSDFRKCSYVLQAYSSISAERTFLQLSTQIRADTSYTRTQINRFIYHYYLLVSLIQPKYRQINCICNLDIPAGITPPINDAGVMRGKQCRQYIAYRAI